MMRANAEAPPLRAGQATTRVTLPSVFTEPEIPRFIRQVYSWRQEPSRKLSSGRRQPLQAGLLCKTVRDLVLGILVPPEPLAAGTLHAWATGGHLQESADLRASLLIRFLFFAKVLLDDVSISYSPAFKQGCVDLLRIQIVVTHNLCASQSVKRTIQRANVRVGSNGARPTPRPHAHSLASDAGEVERTAVERSRPRERRRRRWCAHARCSSLTCPRRVAPSCIADREFPADAS